MYIGSLVEAAAHRAEGFAIRVYPWVKRLPKGRARAGRALMRLLSAMPAR